MSERLPSLGQSRNKTRQLVDKLGYGLAFITLPLGIYAGGAAFLAGEVSRGFMISGLAFLDFTQIREHGRSIEKQSPWNPERLWDKVWGRKRFNQTPSMAMVRAAS